jgi:hypothetical protein
MNAFLDEPRFPAPPTPVTQRDDGPVLVFLEAVKLWRQSIVDLVLKLNADGTAAAFEDFTTRARQALFTFLLQKWPSGMTSYAGQSPYNISPFPTAALQNSEDSLKDRMLEILYWRAAVIDYLGDVWDVLGDPELNVEECLSIERLFRPESPDPLCPFCLGAVLPGRESPGQHDCPLLQHVQTKWPPTPPGLK